MSEAKPLALGIYLARWIVEDGNYDDFHVRETRKFALEFWNPSPLTRTNEPLTSLRRQQDYSYSVSGRLVFASDGVWVVDCGVLAYSEQEGAIEGGCKVGDFVRGELKFGVDPFFYFERHCKIPRIPPLIYEWQINSIEQDTTPYILSNDGRMYIRDESPRSCKAVSSTDKNLIIPDQGPKLFSTVQGSERNRNTSCRVKVVDEKSPFHSLTIIVSVMAWLHQLT